MLIIIKKVIGDINLITIILYGNKRDVFLKNIILHNISNYFTIIYKDKNNILSCGNGKKILLIELDDVSKIDINHCILIFKNKSSIDHISYIADEILCIVNSSRLNQIKILSRLTSKVITCGFSAKDTITFSSNTLENCVISLQRSIMNINNIIVEPFEIPIEIYDEIDDYTLLAYIGLLTFLEKINKNTKIDLSKNCLL